MLLRREFVLDSRQRDYNVFVEAIAGMSQAAPNSLERKQFVAKAIEAKGKIILNSSAKVLDALVKYSAHSALSTEESYIDFANLQLSYAYILAPADGYISRKSVQPGQLVNAGQNLMSLVDDSQLWVAANFKETQIEDMKTGQEVDIKADAYPGHTFKGKIESIQAATGSKFSLLPPDNSTGNFVKVVQRVPVRITLLDDKKDNYELRAGMNVTVVVKVK